MFLTRLKLKNWKNFREADIFLKEYTYLLGANASGKSNLLDVFRFLRDVSKPNGGGLQKALRDRGGFTKLRCLHARQDPEVRIELHFSSDFDSKVPQYKYILAFRNEGKGTHRILISQEKVCLANGDTLVNRPNTHDKKDTELLTQTYLEQIQVNEGFRDISGFLANIDYLHLVPQFLKYSERIGGHYLEDDPFGQGFLRSLAKTSEKRRESRLKKIEKALSLAVPQFAELKFTKDEMGHPHLQTRYKHHRPNAGWQTEEQFSDGTLRLIGILWSLLESNSLLLLEEPELSLNDAIVEQIPAMMHRVQRENKHRRQVIITTHSEKLLSNKGIDPRGVVLLELGKDGTTVRSLDKEEQLSIDAGLSIAEVALPKTKPTSAEQLAFW